MWQVPLTTCSPSRAQLVVRCDCGDASGDTGEPRQVGVEHVDVGFLEVREGRHPLPAFLNSAIEVGPRSSGLRLGRRFRGSSSLLLQVLTHQFERRPLNEPKNGLDLGADPVPSA